MKKLLSLLVLNMLLALPALLSAQVATYTFSQSSGTYTDLGAGDTTVAFATGTATSSPLSLDDVIYPGNSLPFTFGYNGTNYTSFTISSNGFITFGGTDPVGGYYTPISGTTAYNGSVSSFGRDMIGTRGITATRTSTSNILTAVPTAQFVGLEVGRVITGTGIPAGTTITALNQGAQTVTISNGATASGTSTLLVASGSILRSTTGPSGSRVHTIQFKGFRPFSSGANSNYQEFQIKLFEGTNVVQVVYGNHTNSASSTGQVGLRGSANTDFNNRATTTNWSATTAGGANGSTCTVSSTVLPASGLTFIWTPPVPPVADDMGVSAVTIGSSPVQIITAGKGYNLTATAKNYGTNTQNVVPVYYTVNGGSPIGPVNTVGPIATNGTENVLFSGGFAFTPLTPGLYVIEAYTALSGDGNPINDKFTLNVNVVAKLTSFPYLQTFTNPVNWTIVIENLVGTTAVWGLGICVNPDGKVGDTAATANFFNASALRREVLRSPEMDFTGISNPVLSFYTAYRTFTGGENDLLEVVVSTDGGVNFFSATTTYNKSDSTLPSLATRPGQSAAYFPDSSGQWRHETVQLTNVANSSNVVIGFRGVSDFGNRLWIDNVIVSNPDRTCSNIVTATGSYQCDSLLRLNFNTLPLPPKGQNFFADNSAIKEKAEDYNLGNIPAVEGNVSVVSAPNTDNPGGGDAFVSTYLNNDPGQNIEVNTTATTQSGGIFTPSSAYHDYWYRVTYTGNDKTGFANYDLFVYLDGLVFLDPTNLYIMKRSDPTGKWVCLNTTLSGNYLVATGLNDFSDFAIGGSEPLPVELSSFVSVINGNSVTLNWSTSTETNNAGFDIERSAVNGSWSKIGSVSGNGTSTTPHSYSYTDRAVASGKYNYRLKQTDFNGNFEYHNLGSEVIIGVPVKFDLAQNYPNPFNPSTKINYDLPADGKVAIRLFDMSGKEVALLVNEVKTAGYHTVDFNASNLSSGVYFYSISVEANGNNFTATKKMMLVK
jgi:hypothetical protein